MPDDYAAHMEGATYIAIHNYKSGVCYKSRDDGGGKKYTRCGYRKNCDKEAGATPRKGKKFKPWDAHHILPYESINGYGSHAKATLIEDTYKKTDWCMNQDHNLMPLPKMKVYRNKKASWDLDLSAHDVDHNSTKGYNNEVRDTLESQIWNQIGQIQEDGGHYDQEDVEAAFGQWESFYRKELSEVRPMRNGGTRASIEKYQQGTFTNRPPMDVWWAAFSMANNAYVLGSLDGSLTYRRRVFR